MTEPNATAVLVLVFGMLIAVSVLLSRSVDRLGVPVVLLFLVLGMLGGSEGILGLYLDDYELTVRIGTIALVLILFDGGLNTSIASVRSVLAPASVLATLGVVLTAGGVALAARALGLDWNSAMLLGAVVSSTDAAAVFAVLRGGRLQLRPRVGRTIEVESCVNDPMAVILTMTLIEVFTSTGTDWVAVAMSVPLQLLIGAGVGLGVGYAGRAILMRVRIQTSGLFPVLTLALAFVSFGLATVATGSGFLSVFVTGLMLGAGNLPYRNGLTRVHDALAWLCQVTMFLMLGLLVFPSQLLPVAWKGLAIALVIAFVARPVAVWLCLLPFGYTLREVLYIGWTGLRGAVPIILATFPVMQGLPEAARVFHLVFFIVVLSALVPGASIVPMARRLRVSLPGRAEPAAAIELNSLKHLSGDIKVYHIHPSVAVCGATLAEIAFPPGASAVLVVRDQQLIAARGHTQLLEGDHVYVFCQPEDEPLIGLMFGDALNS